MPPTTNSQFDPNASKLPGPNVLLMGPGGTGKTYAIGTLVDAGVEVFYLAIEQGLETLFGYYADQGKPIPDNLHWHKIEPPKASFSELEATALKVNTQSYETLAKSSDLNRHTHNLFISVMRAMADFPDDRTGQKFGPVDGWAPGRAVVIDGLTGLSNAAMSMVVGARPTRGPGDYGVAQNQLAGFLRLCCDHLKCWFVLIAHIERETDLVQGGSKITVSTLGKALPPIIPPMFSDVILTVREGTKWTWSTATANADTKARNVPWAEGIPADFRHLYATWAKRAQAMG